MNLFVVLGLIAKAVRGSLVQGPWCADCGYSLKGITGGSCPECGAVCNSQTILDWPWIKRQCLRILVVIWLAFVALAFWALMPGLNRYTWKVDVKASYSAWLYPNTSNYRQIAIEGTDDGLQSVWYWQLWDTRVLSDVELRLWPNDPAGMLTADPRLNLAVMRVSFQNYSFSYRRGQWRTDVPQSEVVGRGIPDKAIFADWLSSNGVASLSSGDTNEIDDILRMLSMLGDGTLPPRPGTIIKLDRHGTFENRNSRHYYIAPQSRVVSMLIAIALGIGGAAALRMLMIRRFQIYERTSETVNKEN